MRVEQFFKNIVDSILLYSCPFVHTVGSVYLPFNLLQHSMYNSGRRYSKKDWNNFKSKPFIPKLWRTWINVKCLTLSKAFVRLTKTSTTCSLLSIIDSIRFNNNSSCHYWSSSLEPGCSISMNPLFSRNLYKNTNTARSNKIEVFPRSAVE